MSACPYRKWHEFGEDGLCKHCYAPEKETEPVQTLEVSPMSRLSCSVAGCGEPGATFIRVNHYKWSTRCRLHERTG